MLTKRQVMKLQSSYKESSKMYSMVSEALMVHFHYRLNQIANHTRHPGCVAYALQKSFKEELQHLQQQGIIAPLGIDKIAEWCNNFILVPKLSGKVRLCLDPVRLNQELNDIFPKLNNVKYLSLIDTSSGYHYLKLDERSSYLTTFACQFGWYRYKRLPFGAAPTGDMFKRKID